MAEAVPSMPEFFKEPQHSHHKQMIALCALLGVVAVGSWAYATYLLPSPIPPPITVAPMKHVDLATQIRRAMAEKLQGAVGITPADSKQMAKNLSKAKPITDAQKQAMAAALRGASPQ